MKKLFKILIPSLSIIVASGIALAFIHPSFNETRGEMGDENSVVITSTNYSGSGNTFTAKTKNGNDVSFELNNITLSGDTFSITSLDNAYVKNTSGINGIYKIEVFKDLDEHYLLKEFNLKFDCSSIVNPNEDRAVTKKFRGYYDFSEITGSYVRPDYFAIQYSGYTLDSFKALVISYTCDGNHCNHNFKSISKPAYQYDDAYTADVCSCCGKINNKVITSGTAPWRHLNSDGSLSFSIDRSSSSSANGYKSEYSYDSNTHTLTGYYNTALTLSNSSGWSSQSSARNILSMKIRTYKGAYWGPNFYFYAYSSTISTGQMLPTTQIYNNASAGVSAWINGGGHIYNEDGDEVTSIKDNEFFTYEIAVSKTIKMFKFVLGTDEKPSESTYQGKGELQIADISFKEACTHTQKETYQDSLKDTYERCVRCGHEELIAKTLPMKSAYIDNVFNNVYPGSTSPDGVKGTYKIQSMGAGVWDGRISFETALLQAKTLGFKDVSWSFYCQSGTGSNDSFIALYMLGYQIYLRSSTTNNSYYNTMPNNIRNYVYLNGFNLNDPMFKINLDAWNTITIDISSTSAIYSDPNLSGNPKVALYPLNTTSYVYFKDLVISRDSNLMSYDLSLFSYESNYLTVNTNATTPDGVSGVYSYTPKSVSGYNNMWYERFSPENLFKTARNNGMNKIRVDMYFTNITTGLMYIGEQQFSVTNGDKVSVWKSDSGPYFDKDGVGYSGDLNCCDYFTINGGSAKENVVLKANGWNTFIFDLSNPNCSICSDLSKADRFTFYSSNQTIYIRPIMMYK